MRWAIRRGHTARGDATDNMCSLNHTSTTSLSQHHRNCQHNREKTVPYLDRIAGPIRVHADLSAHFAVRSSPIRWLREHCWQGTGEGVGGGGLGKRRGGHGFARAPGHEGETTVETGHDVGGKSPQKRRS